MARRLSGSREPLLAVPIVALACLFGLLAPEFLSLNHVVGIGRNSVVTGIMSLGMLLGSSSAA